MSERCTAITKAGKRCTQWATDRELCWRHLDPALRIKPMPTTEPYKSIAAWNAAHPNARPQAQFMAATVLTILNAISEGATAAQLLNDIAQL